MPLINICSKGDCELKDIQNFLVVINDNNVRLEVGDAQIGRDCATTICVPAWKITELVAE